MLGLSKRSLKDFQKVEFALLLLPIKEELAKKRQEATQLAGKNSEGKPVTQQEIGVGQLALTEEKGRARDQVAKKIGVSARSRDRKVQATPTNWWEWRIDGTIRYCHLAVPYPKKLIEIFS